jgi:hypothetical protein
MLNDVDTVYLSNQKHQTGLSDKFHPLKTGAFLLLVLALWN